MKASLFFILLFVTVTLTAQNPKLIKTVSSTVLVPANKNQEPWVNNQWNGMVFYQGTGTPAKLCVTDGTIDGTRFVANLGTGGFHAILPAKDFVYIVTSEVVSVSPFTFKYEIWKSDGTAAGTSNVYTLPNAIGVSNGGQFFSDRQSTYNFSLDGTTNILYFGQYDAANGNELWRTDGTTAGTFLLKDIKPGSGGSFPWGFCKIGNEVFFNATEITFERKLWKTDGTTAGTVQVPVAEPFFIVDGAIAKLGSKMVFFAHNTIDGYEPYISDGTTAGTFMLGNINTTSVNSGNSGLPYVDEANLKANSKYCFLILHNGTDTSLYRTDGTISGTIRVAPAGVSIHCRLSSGGYSDVDENGIWIMKYNNTGSGNSETLYKSDGTLAGTYQVADNISYGQKLKLYKNGLWMQARNSGSVSNVEPWRSGGNPATTNRAFEIAPGGPLSGFFYSSDPFGFHVTNNKLYFFATNAGGNSSLYEYNGDFTFNGSVAGGNWKDSANWNSAMPPGIVDTVYVNEGTPNTLTVNDAKGFAGTLILGSNASVSINNSTDSLFIAKELSPSGNNSFTGNGVLVSKSYTNSDVQFKKGFTANTISIESNTSLQEGVITVYNGIRLLKGKLTLNTGILLMKGSSSTVDALNNNFIVTNSTGNLQIESIGSGGRTGTVLFPIGNTSYNPVTISNGGTTDAFGARVITGISTTYTGETPGTLLNSGAVNRTWMITESNNGGSNAVITLQWNETDELPGFDRNATSLGHYSGGAWTVGGQSAAAGTNPYTYSRAGITSFSPFGILNNVASRVDDLWRSNVRLNVFPNPAQSFLNITLTEQMQKETLQLYIINAAGQFVMRKQLAPSGNNCYFLNTNGLSKGVYSLFMIGKTIRAKTSIVIMK